LQRICKPPVGDGEDCSDGPEVLTKDCNEQPCPDLGKKGSNGGSTLETRPPVVRAQKISNRP